MFLNSYRNTIMKAETGEGVQATITVYKAGTLDLATLYSTATGTAKDNPFITDTYGRFNFYAAQGRYDIKVTGTGITTYTIENVSLVKEDLYVDVREFATFADAIDAIGASEKTLLITDEQTVAGDKTVPANVTLKFLQGGSLNIADTKTVTINGHVDAGLYQIFKWSGTGKVVFGAGAVKEVYPEWWGAKGDGVTDSTVAIQAAIDSLPNGGVVIFSAGTYISNSTINVPYQYISFLGMGRKSYLKSGISNNTDPLLNITKDYFSARNMTINAPNGTTYALYLNGASRSFFQDLHIRAETTSSCVYAENSYIITWINVYMFYGEYSFVDGGNSNGYNFIGGEIICSKGLKFLNSYKIVMNGVVIEAMISGGYAIEADDCRSVTIQNCYFESNVGGDIRIGNTTACYQVSLRDNIHLTEYPGIFAVNIQKSFTSVLLSGNLYAGEMYSLYAAPAVRIIGQGNESVGYGSWAIQEAADFQSGENFMPDPELNRGIWPTVNNCSIALITLREDRRSTQKAQEITINAGQTSGYIELNLPSQLINEIGGQTVVFGIAGRSNNARMSISYIDNWGTASTSDVYFVSDGLWRQMQVSSLVAWSGTRWAKVRIGIVTDSPAIGTEALYISDPYIYLISSGGAAIAKRSMYDYKKPVIEYCSNAITVFIAQDTTPSVEWGGSKIFKTANTQATIISMFDNGVIGQEIKVIFTDSNTTIDFTETNLKGNNGVDWTPTNGDWMEAVFDGTNWYCSVHDCTA